MRLSLKRPLTETGKAIVTMTQKSNKKYHSHSKTGRPIILAASIITMPCILMADTVNPLSMTIETYLNPTINEDQLFTMNEWLQSNNCKITIQSGREKNSDLLFSVFLENNVSPQPVLMAKTRGGEPLKDVWLVHRSTGANELSSISGQRVALLPQSSLLGHQAPVKQLTDAGLKIDDLTIYTSEEYQGAIALLLHGDVMAASAPLPLAKPWANANDLTILTNNEAVYVSGIWQLSANLITQECIDAFVNIERESRQDLKMKIFPEWLEGFTLNKQ